MSDQPLEFEGKISPNGFVMFLKQLVENNVYGTVHLRGSQNHSLNFINGLIVADEPEGTKGRTIGRITASTLLSRLSKNQGFVGTYRIEPLTGDPDIHLRRLYEPFSLIIGRTTTKPAPESTIETRPRPKASDRPTPTAGAEQRSQLAVRSRQRGSIERDSGLPLPKTDITDPIDRRETSVRAPSLKSSSPVEPPTVLSAPQKAPPKPEPRTPEPPVPGQRLGSNNLVADKTVQTSPAATTEPDIPNHTTEDPADEPVKAEPTRQSALRRLINSLSS